jgi:hypothetical protein
MHPVDLVIAIAFYLLLAGICAFWTLEQWSASRTRYVLRAARAEWRRRRAERRLRRDIDQRPMVVARIRASWEDR